ncbi:hypothetical protein Tco_0951493 [Tanacetum coccineum]|uniref:Uncharacterized protein n=1 Tax=Tanacetum coccineum TaxID=301880 RepID=A0ABQ5DWZ8_9ASTR
MDAPPSPNHVFDFPEEEELEEDPQEEPDEEFEEDPEEDPEEELEVDAKEDATPAATPPVGSPSTPPPLSESSSDTEVVAPIFASKALEMPPPGSTSERCEKKRQAEMDVNSFEIRKVKRRMYEFDQDLGHEGAMDACPDDGVDGSAAFEESQPPKPQGPPDDSHYLSASNMPRIHIPLRPILGVLQIGIRAKVMDAPALPISAERNLEDPIEIRVDVVHPAPVDVFPAATVVRTLAQHGEAIRDIHEHLQGVPIDEEMSALRFRVGMAEEENASLYGRIKTMEATDTVTRRQEKKARMELERQLASVQESQRQDQENFRKLQEFVTSQLRRHS